MSNDQSTKKSSWAVTPGYILDDDDLDEGAKNLYSRISMYLSDGRCWATNNHFAEKHKVSLRTIQNWLSQLKDKGYIEIEVFLEGTQTRRNIWITVDFKKNTPPCNTLHAPLQQDSCPPEAGCIHINNRDKYKKDKRERELASPLSLAPPPKEIISYKKLSLEKERLGKLIEKFGKDTVMEMCDELDNYADIYPKKFKAYACHVAVLTSWLSRKTSDGPNSLSKASNLIQRLKDKSEVASKLGIEINDVYVDFRRPGEYYRVSDKTFVQDVMHSFRKRGAPDKFLKYLENGELL